MMPKEIPDVEAPSKGSKGLGEQNRSSGFVRCRSWCIFLEFNHGLLLSFSLCVFGSSLHRDHNSEVVLICEELADVIFASMPSGDLGDLFYPG